MIFNNSSDVMMTSKKELEASDLYYLNLFHFT